MEWGYYVKRSWQITWRYKALWVLGLFAGVTGCQGGGGNGGGGNSFGGDNSFGGGSGSTDPFTAADWSRFADQAMTWVPAVIAAIVLLMLIGLVWSVFSIAARGGLVTAANEIEASGTSPSLGTLWGSGFSRFWSLVGVDVFLKFPIFVLAMILVAVAVVPLIASGFSAAEPGLAEFSPMIVAFIVGLPVLLVASLVLGIMHPIAVRYVMLGGRSAGGACSDSWRFLRGRTKDTVVMWLMSGLLTIGASIVVAIPIIAVAIGLGVGVAVAAMQEQWSALFGVVGIVLVLAMLVGSLYNAVWGTYTSTLWTLFFRDVTGMRVIPSQPPVDVHTAQVQPPVSPAPPMAPQPPTGTSPIDG